MAEKNHLDIKHNASLNHLLPFERIKRTVIVKKEADTSEKFGFHFNKRPIKELIKYGVVNVDKPKGPTSHQVSAYVKQILKIEKAGHSGTLDPKVTGVLPVALEKATRVVQAILPAGKEYVAIMHLHKELTEKEIHDGLNKFIGKIMQMPPVKSAIKRRLREREIYYLEIIEIDGQDVLFKVGSQAGTYIRKLIYDMGIALGTNAHMAELRRSRAGPFDETNLSTLQQLTDAIHYFNQDGNEVEIRKRIIPVEFAVQHLPKVWVFDTTVNTLCHGANLNAPGISKIESDIVKGDTVAVMTLKNELVCLGEAYTDSKGMLADKGLSVVVNKVFMEPETYPKISLVK